MGFSTREGRNRYGRSKLEPVKRIAPQNRLGIFAKNSYCKTDKYNGIVISAKAYYDQLFQDATTAHQSGELTKAIALYKQLVRDISGQPEPYHRLALIYAQKGQYEEAVSWFEKAINLSADNPVYNNNFAETLQRLNENERAVDLLRKVMIVEPGFYEAKQKLAVILKKTGQYEESSQLFNELIVEQPRYYPAFFQLGTLMLETGNFKSAKKYLKTAVELNPKATKALNNLAIAHQEWEEYDEAIEYYKLSLEIDANYLDGIRNLALICEKVGQTEQSKMYWERLARLNENDPLIQWKANLLEPIVYHSKSEIDDFRETVKRELRTIKTKKINIDTDQLTKLDIYPPAGLIYHGQNDLEIKKKYGQLFNGIPKVKLQPKTSAKPRIGFVVTGGHEGVFVKCMRGILNNLSTDKFDITVVCSFPNGEKIVRRGMENPVIKFVNLPKSLGQSVQLLLSLNFDLLHYWEVGTDAYNYFIPYFKPARIQCTSWGWPITSGIPTMDYFISSVGLDQQSSQNDYTEKLVLFDKLPAYYYPPEIPTLDRTRTDFGIEESSHLYLCVQNVKKVHPDMDGMIRAILEKDPKAVVVFLGDKHAVVTTSLEKRIKSNCRNHADRVMILDRQEKEGYFNILNLADLVIDTLYYNGGANTNGDSFALNKPVVTMPVDFHRGRYTAAAYRQMGVEDLIAVSKEEYVDLAVRLALDREFNAEVCKKIAEQKHNFFEDKEAVIELENFLSTVINGLKSDLLETQESVLASVRQHNESDRFNESLAIVDSFLKQQPDSALVWLEKGLIHRELHQLKPAFDALNRARQLDTTSPVILKRFAELLSDIGKNEDAFIAYKKALELSPDDAEILNNFGGLLLENRQFEEAIPLLKRSGEIDPKQQSAFVNLGMAYENRGEATKAMKVYREIISRLPENDLFKLHIETLCPNVAHSNEQIDNYRTVVKEALLRFDQLVPMHLSVEKLDHSYAFPSFSFTYQGKNVKEIKALWGEFYAKRIEPVVLGPKNTKPKFGFLVTQSHEGVFMKDAGGFLKNLSAEKLDILVLANGPESIQNLKTFVDRDDVSFVSFSRNLQSAIHEISILNLDFLYYWEIGSDGLNYFLPYFQLARIQISSWGSAFTSGNPRVQYYWSSKWLENENHLDHYTEEVVLFENLPTYYYRTGESGQPKSRSDFDLPEQSRVYLCVQSMNKIHPDFDVLIKGILEADSKALICFTTPKKEALVNQLLERFQRTLGQQMDRIKVIRKLEHQDYLRLIKVADVCLDPPHYSGANTTYETLQMGVPVITLPGQFQRGKYSEAIYRILGLEDYIPNSEAQYVELALKLAKSSEAKDEFFKHYAQHSHMLFEQVGIIEEIEAFLLSQFDQLY
ncbi:tetratricopeptide repeat protein [Reichenbachiella sp.]|uniref:tetratricopeptide repeat protein n=2 Tax=Reichenbachiella sp. TaxID=2184521 RepID=UPI003296EF31